MATTCMAVCSWLLMRALAASNGMGLYQRGWGHAEHVHAYGVLLSQPRSSRSIWFGESERCWRRWALLLSTSTQYTVFVLVSSCCSAAERVMLQRSIIIITGLCMTRINNAKFGRVFSAAGAEFLNSTGSFVTRNVVLLIFCAIQGPDLWEA
jgi:hypothetical protein